MRERERDQRERERPKRERERPKRERERETKERKNLKGVERVEKKKWGLIGRRIGRTQRGEDDREQEKG